MIIGNYIANYKESGLRIDRCSNSIVVNNAFASDGEAEYGLSIASPFNNNTFYHNNFLNNTEQTLIFNEKSDWDGLINHWDKWQRRKLLEQLLI